MLTPEEFVECGDQLVHSCPTWAWAGGDASRAKSYLPAEKQFLITRNVPCHRRCKQVRAVWTGVAGWSGCTILWPDRVVWLGGL